MTGVIVIQLVQGIVFQQAAQKVCVWYDGSHTTYYDFCHTTVIFILYLCIGYFVLSRPPIMSNERH